MGSLCNSQIVSKEEIFYYKAVEQNITSETTEAKQRDRYFGCDAKEWERVDPKKFNSGVPRSFTKGCWKHDD